MIGKTMAAMGRRNILRGALGLGAAIGLGAPRSSGASLGSPPSFSERGENGSGRCSIDPEPEWFRSLSRESHAAVNAINNRPDFDGLDLDLAMLRSPSPAYKIVMQRRRHVERRKACQTIWDRLDEARNKWMKGILS